MRFAGAIRIKTAAPAVLLAALSVVQDASAERARVTYGPIPDDVWSYMLGKSWHAELPCPQRRELALLRAPYLDFQGRTQIGTMIVAKSVASQVAAVFQEIFDNGKFRINKMVLIDEYQGDDDRSMEDNNTSAFNCRTTDTGAMSRHAFGTAIDINPVQNPYRKGSLTAPEAGKAYDAPHKRKRDIVGLIMKGDVVTTAFARRGWFWGGNWKRSVDYQHFSNDGH